MPTFVYEGVIIPPDRPMVLVHKGWRVSKASSTRGAVPTNDGHMIRTEKWRVHPAPAQRPQSHKASMERTSAASSICKRDGTKISALPEVRIKDKKKSKALKPSLHNEKSETAISTREQPQSPPSFGEDFTLLKSLSHLPSIRKSEWMAIDHYLNYCKLPAIFRTIELK